MYLRASISLYACNVHFHLLVNVHAYKHMCVRVRVPKAIMRVCICVFVFVHVCLFVYICMHVHACVQASLFI